MRGAYRFVRNPGEMLAVTAAFAVAALLRAPFLVVGAIGFAIVGAIAARLEEAWRRARRGPDYARYLRRVKRWRPRLRPYDPAREANEPAIPAERTRAPGRTVVLYDGQCAFCVAQTRTLTRLAAPGAIDLRDFQAEGALDEFPGVTWDACMQAMQLITPSGRVFSGFEAAVRAVATRRPLGLLAYGYYLPGVRLVCDAIYAAIAANRYRIARKKVAAGECPDGSCALHLKRK